ncbi:hypothetical protein ONZ45_g5012 [Pleurotus djamor]|nr:hypothetical protein ONZ45_g5012 [Pleurotus djamor]
MLVFNPSTMSPAIQVPGQTQPPSPLRRKFGSLQSITGKWCALVAQCRLIRRIHDIFHRMRTTERSSFARTSTLVISKENPISVLECHALIEDLWSAVKATDLFTTGPMSAMLAEPVIITLHSEAPAMRAERPLSDEELEDFVRKVMAGETVVVD